MTSAQKKAATKAKAKTIEGTFEVGYTEHPCVGLGVPKFIWSSVTGESFLDVDGTYGLGNNAYAIVDTPENLPLIKKAFDNPKFRTLMAACCFDDITLFDPHVIATFRKDFWKDFV